MRVGLAFVLVILLVGVAAAQDTGGSFGGGDWSSSSSSSSSGYSSSGYDSSSSSYDYSSSGSSHGGGGSLGGGELVIIVIGVIIYAVVMIAKQANRGGGYGGASLYSGGSSHGYVNPSMDITLLRFALDARTRPFVQAELDRIAKSASTATAEGRAAALRETALLLRRVRDGWVYGGAQNFPMSDRSTARRSFEEHLAATRAMFKRELVRNAGGVVTTGETGDYPRRSHEGPGLVLVTILVAAKRELFTVQRIGDGDDLRRALEVLSALDAATLAAMEVVWTPADPEDRMSSMELEALLPGAVFPIQGAMVGAVVCAYCGGPFPKELLSCPHCGGRLSPGS